MKKLHPRQTRDGRVPVMCGFGGSNPPQEDSPVRLWYTGKLGWSADTTFLEFSQKVRTVLGDFTLNEDGPEPAWEKPGGHEIASEMAAMQRFFEAKERGKEAVRMEVRVWGHILVKPEQLEPLRIAFDGGGETHL